MAKHHPILTLFSSLVMEAPLSSGWTRRGSRTGAEPRDANPVGFGDGRARRSGQQTFPSGATQTVASNHTGATISLKGAVMDSLETLAGRLGVRIRLTSNGRLESATIEVARIEDTTRKWDEPPR